MRRRSSNPAASIRLVLADDHPLVLEGLRTLLEREPGLHVVAAVTEGESLLRAVQAHRPDMVILDLRLPGVDGLTCLRHIRTHHPDVRVLILTAFDDPEAVREAFELGADGFALKTDPPQMVIAAVWAVYHGRMVFPRIAARAVQEEYSASLLERLSPREREVLALVAEGLTNAQIAARLYISDQTVKFHLRNIYQKLGVATRTEAAAYYHRHVSRTVPYTERSSR